MVGLLQLGVELQDLLQGPGELAVLLAQLVEGGRGRQLGELGADLLPRRPRTAGREPFEHAYPALGGVELDQVDETSRQRHAVGGMEVGLRGKADRDEQTVLVQQEDDGRVDALAEDLPADLAQRRGHPDLVLGLQPDRLGHLPAQPAHDEHVLVVLDPEADQLFRGHGSGLTAITLASSLRVPASRSNVAATTEGARATSPG